MIDLIGIINNNSNIDITLKNKVIECVKLIVEKYPMTYQNLYKKLETIIIRYSDNNDNERLQKLGVDSVYNCTENLMILNEKQIHSTNYKYILLHELLHVASFNELNLGFKSIDNEKGISLNEGMTEYLVQEILNDHTVGMNVYENDVNNIRLLSVIIPIEKLINLYFTDGLIDLFGEYINVLNNNNLKKLIELMDKEHIERVRKRNFDNEYKDQYIKLFVNDISLKEFNNNLEIMYVITVINDFLKRQYKIGTVPLNIKKTIEDSINRIISNLNLEKGKKHE